jgi:small-conductance mechanosensitive channel
LLAFSPLATATETAPVSSPDLSAIRRESAEHLRRLKGQQAAQQSAGGAASGSLLDELALWRQIELIVAQRETVLQEMQSARAAAEITAAADIEITNFLELEEERDTLAIKQGKLESLRREIQAEHSLMLETKESLQRAEQDRRRVAENLLTASDGSRQALQTEERLDAVRIRLQQQQLALHRDTIAEMTQRQQLVESSIDQHRDRIARAGNGIRLSKTELEQQLTRIADMEQTVRGQLSKLDQQMHSFLLDSSNQQSTAASTRLGVIREESQMLRQLLSEIAAIRECWMRRYHFSNQDGPADQWMTWRDEARQAEERLTQIQNRLATRTMERRQQVAAIQSQSASGTDELSSQLAQIEAIIDAYGNLQVLAAKARRTYIRFSEDLEAQYGGHSIRALSVWAGNRFRSIWDYELTAVDDRSVTVGKLVIAFLLLIVGLIISKWTSSIVAFRVLPRFGFSHAAAMTIRQMMMYGLIVAVAMLSLKMVNVPLTIFAFLGGAAAIGVGIGSQNTVANFISGLILLIQRPIRIGDLVNVDGIDANVEHIGARATRVRTSENLEVLIPNSNILQNKVTNWTLSDTRIRSSVAVGVAYGTNVQPVIETLQRVANRNPKVLDQPCPIVLFEDFGDSSLVFKVHFWSHMRTIIEGQKLCSEIRVAIDDAFRHAGIVIAFPQRDVHLDLQSPIEVALTDGESSMLRRPRRAA